MKNVNVYFSLRYTDAGKPVAFVSVVTAVTEVEESYEVFSRKNEVIFSFHCTKHILPEISFLCQQINKEPRRT